MCSSDSAEPDGTVEAHLVFGDVQYKPARFPTLQQRPAFVQDPLVGSTKERKKRSGTGRFVVTIKSSMIKNAAK